MRMVQRKRAAAMGTWRAQADRRLLLAPSAGRCCSGRSEAAAGTKYWLWHQPALALLLRQIGGRCWHQVCGTKSSGCCSHRSEAAAAAVAAAAAAAAAAQIGGGGCCCCCWWHQVLSSLWNQVCGTKSSGCCSCRSEAAAAAAAAAAVRSFLSAIVCSIYMLRGHRSPDCLLQSLLHQETVEPRQPPQRSAPVCSQSLR